MADKKISALTAATTPLAGTEVLPIVQSSTTVKVAVSNLTAGRAVNVGSLTSTGDILLDGSANPTITLKTSGAGNNPLYRIQADTNYWDMIGIFSNADDPFRIRYNGTDFFQIANTGGVSIGNTTDPGAGNLSVTGEGLFKSPATGNNFRVFSSASGTNAAFTVLGSGTVNGIATGANGAASAMYVNKDSGSARSINAAGSLNASGADYAEYETKNDDCGQVAKGQIVGFDQDGKLTDKWAQAKSFAVKTTNPSYVGGDTWGNEKAIGLKPEDIADNATPEEVEQYKLAMSAWKEKLEAARQKVDRIAYAGKVPCNVMGAKVGDYIIAVQNGEAIDGHAVEVPTFDQYRFAVGKVRSILSDGRCEIAVIVH